MTIKGDIMSFDGTGVDFWEKAEQDAGKKMGRKEAYKWAAVNYPSDELGYDVNRYRHKRSI